MTITANEAGHISGQFTIPANIPYGTKLVEFEGAQTQAQATFIGKGTLKVEELQLVTTTVNRRTLNWRYDPIAQTFVMPSRQQVAAVDLWFTAVGTTNVLLQIRDVSLGFPTQDVVAECILRPSEITAGTWTRFKFRPVVLEAGREYALTVLCNDATSAVAIAGVGEFDATAQKWVTAQPYQVGVLLSSSNGATWTAHQTQDLAFRLLACDFDVETNTHYEGSTTKTFALPNVTVTDADHLLVLAAVERPTADCDVVFHVTVDGTTYAVSEGQPFTLAARYSGIVTWDAVLSGTYTASPTLHKDIHLVSAKRLTDSTYISRAMQCNGGTKLTCYYDAYLPGTTSIDASVLDDNEVWQALPIIEGTELGDGWVEIKRELTPIDYVETRVKLVLHGSGTEIPLVKNLRVAII